MTNPERHDAAVTFALADPRLTPSKWSAHVRRVGDDDMPVIIASGLTSMQAGMLRELLESAGIGALVIDTVRGTRAVGPGKGDARLVVRAADVPRAREIVASSGAVPGPGPDERIDIPEAEWSRASTETTADEAAPESVHLQEDGHRPLVRGGSRPRWRALVPALFVVALITSRAMTIGCTWSKELTR